MRRLEHRVLGHRSAGHPAALDRRPALDSITLPDTTPGEGEVLSRVQVGLHGYLAEGRTPSTPVRRLVALVRRRPLVGRARLRAARGHQVREGAGHNPDGSFASDGVRIVAYRDGSGPIAWSSFDGATWGRLSMSGSAPKQADFIVLPMGILAVSAAGVWFGDAS